MSNTYGLRHPNGSICRATVRACRYASEPHTAVEINSPESLTSSLGKLDEKIAQNAIPSIPAKKSAKVPPRKSFFADESTLDKRAASKDPSLSREKLMELSKSKDIITRIGVASNPSTPKDVLAKLALDTDWGVRMGVAKNNSTSREVRALLATDSNREVLYELARNKIFK